MREIQESSNLIPFISAQRAILRWRGGSPLGDGCPQLVGKLLIAASMASPGEPRGPQLPFPHFPTLQSSASQYVQFWYFSVRTARVYLHDIHWYQSQSESDDLEGLDVDTPTYPYRWTGYSYLLAYSTNTAFSGSGWSLSPGGTIIAWTQLEFENEIKPDLLSCGWGIN